MSALIRRAACAATASALLLTPALPAVASPAGTATGVRLTGVPATVAYDHTFTVKGLVSHGSGRWVDFQLKHGSRYVTEARKRVGTGGAVSATFPGLAAGSHGIRLTVERSGSKKAVSSATVNVHVSSPPPPPPPAPARQFLQDMSVSAGSVDYSNRTDEVNGASFPNSLELYCNGSVTFNTGKAWSSLHVGLGLRDDSPSTSFAQVEVLADNRDLYRQQVNFATSNPLDLDLTGVVALTFRVDCYGNNYPTVVLGNAYASTIATTHPSTHTGPTVSWLTDGPDVDYLGGNIYTGRHVSVSGHLLPNSIEDSVCVGCSGGPENIQYNLGRAYSHLTGFIGLDDNDSTGTGSIVIVVDGVTVGTYPVQPGTFTPVDLNVAGGLRLEIEFKGAGGSPTLAFGDIRLLTGGDTPPTTISTTPAYF